MYSYKKNISIFNKLHIYYYIKTKVNVQFPLFKIQL